MAAFATPDYIAKHPDIAETRGLGAQWIGWGSVNDWVETSPLPLATVKHSLPDIFMQTAAAQAGLGMAWVPAFLGDTVDGLCRVPGVPIEPNRSIWILLHGDLRRTARVRAVVDFVADWVTSRKSLFQA